MKTFQLLVNPIKFLSSWLRQAPHIYGYYQESSSLWHPHSAAETISTTLTDANDYRNNCDDSDDHSDKENMANKVKK
jgi:hypothetical protein